MTVDLPRSLQPFVRFVACLAALALASCGGGVSAPTSPVVNSPALSLLPGDGTILYSGLPTTFILSGGTGAYILTSSNQAIIPVAGGLSSSSFTVVPNPVTAETAVTLTLRDTGTAAPVTASVTVRPGTVANNLTITPSSTQSSTCNPAVCSGGDASVTVTISQGGIPLAARGVRFDVVSGDFAFIVTPPGTGGGELLSTSTTTTTDQAGVARARIRVTPLAPNQTALILVTDLGSGAYQRASFAIAQFNGNASAFFTIPSVVTLTGPYLDGCPVSTSTAVTVFGGSPPYTITGGSSGVSVSPTFVPNSGGQFSLVLGANAGCPSTVTFGVTDSSGRTIPVTLNTAFGTLTRPAPVVPLALVPSALTMFCGFDASIAIVGGSGTSFAAGSSSSLVLPTVATRTVTLKLNAPYAGTPPPVTITVTDGTTSATALVNIPANCP